MRCLVFGSTGQAGSYLVEHLRSLGREVACPTRAHLDLESASPADILCILNSVKPDEVYNFAGLMYAPKSWESPLAYWQVNVTVPLMILESIAKNARARYFQAGSASMFEPDTPYGVAAASASQLVKDFREHYGMFACTGTFYNMESPRRAKTFFAQKVCSEAVRIKRQGEGAMKMVLGKLSDERDWGWAPEYVIAAQMMLARDEPDDFTVGTGVRHSCREFVVEALKCAGLSPVSSEALNVYVNYDFRRSISKSMCASYRETVRTTANLGWTARTCMPGVVRNLVKAYEEEYAG